MIGPSFQGANKLFVLSFENEAQTISYKKIFFPTVEVKNYNVMIDEQNFFDQPVKINLRTYSIQKLAIGQGDDSTTGCLLYNRYFKKY